MALECIPVVWIRLAQRRLEVGTPRQVSLTTTASTHDEPADDVHHPLILGSIKKKASFL